jgi:hypothetical protein
MSAKFQGRLAKIELMIAIADHRRALSKCDCPTLSVVHCYSDEEEAEAIEAHKNRPCPYHGLKHRRELNMLTIHRYIPPKVPAEIKT